MIIIHDRLLLYVVWRSQQVSIACIVGKIYHNISDLPVRGVRLQVAYAVSANLLKVRPLMLPTTQVHWEENKYADSSERPSQLQ